MFELKTLKLFFFCYLFGISDQPVEVPAGQLGLLVGQEIQVKPREESTFM